jgi:hypothetical protein
MLRGVNLDGLDGVGVAPPGILEIMKGDTVRMSVSFKYRGPAQNVTLRCSIGTRIAGVFNESCYGLKTIPLSKSPDFLDYANYADIITTMNPGTGYDIEAKISEYTSATLVGYDNVINVIGAAEFQNFTITDYSKV